MWGLKGVKKLEVERGYAFHDEVTRGESAGLKGKISGENHPFVEHFKFVKLFEDDLVTARTDHTGTSPGFWLNWSGEIIWNRQSLTIRTKRN